MRLRALVLVVHFLACTANNVCSPQTCSDCCSAEGTCVACPLDGGTTGSGGGLASGGGSEGQGGGFSTGGGTTGTGGGAGGGNNSGGGTGGGTSSCASGTICSLGANSDPGYCCGNVCQAVGTDVLNCGGCGVRCPAGASCVGGICSADCDAGSCPSGTRCNNTLSSQLACYPTSCSGVPQGDHCGQGGQYAGKCCGGACLDTNHDKDNCGSCGTKCGAGDDCVWGSCQPHEDCTTLLANSDCQKPGSMDLGKCCNGQCVDLDSQGDRENCGGCGLHCPVGDVCTNGTCKQSGGANTLGCHMNSATQCAPGTSCAATGVRCKTDSCSVDTWGAPCTGNGNSVCCGNACVDIYSDANNCNGCGLKCGSGQFCNLGVCAPTPTCSAANSGVSCPLAGGGVGQCCAGNCVNRQTNSTHCGACGASCSGSNTCSQGQCRLADGGFPGDCTGGCPAGTVCDGNKCLPLECQTGATGTACGFGRGVGDTAYATVTGRCCNGTCVDLGQDKQNCTACGKSCTSGLCTSGDTFTAKGPTCYAPASSNCGATGCPGDTFCTEQGCVPRTCVFGFSGGTCQTSTLEAGMCCSMGFNSGCINPTNDANNCGGCGIKCGAGASCDNGVCSNITAPCKAGTLGQFCNLDAGTGYLCCPGGGCTNTATDSKNCGQCGRSCDAGTCVNGSCQ